MNLKFEKSKLKRELKRSGKEYKFYKNGLNEFGEPNDEEELVGTVVALYHETNSKVSETLTDTTVYRNKKEPMLLCLYEDATFLNSECFLTLNGTKMKVTKVVNVQEWNIIADISLEVVDCGS